MSSFTIISAVIPIPGH